MQNRQEVVTQKPMTCFCTKWPNILQNRIYLFFKFVSKNAWKELYKNNMKSKLQPFWFPSSVPKMYYHTTVLVEGWNFHHNTRLFASAPECQEKTKWSLLKVHNNAQIGLYIDWFHVTISRSFYGSSLGWLENTKKSTQPRYMLFILELIKIA